MVKDVRGKGLMVGIEFGPPKSLKLKAGWTALEKAQEGLFAHLVVMGLTSMFVLSCFISRLNSQIR